MPYSHLRSQFLIPEHQYYLASHSLGPISISAKSSIEQALAQWQHAGVTAWHHHDWLELNQRCGHLIAKLIGAFSHEVIVCDSTTINLYKVLYCALKLQPQRHVILTQKHNFPTDLYVAQGLQHCFNHLKIVEADEDIEALLNADVAVLYLSHVNYRTSALNDIVALTTKAHALGIIVVLDVSHSVGCLALDLHHAQVDFAVGCTYKHLCGGPGSPSFIYVNQRHHDKINLPILGWMGHAKPFDFDEVYQPHLGVKQFLTGTPSILSLKALEGALTLFEDQDIKQLEQAKRALEALYLKILFAGDNEFNLISPLDSTQRGGHLTLAHPQAERIVNTLLAKHILVDFRPPNLIRFTLNPLFIDSKGVEHCAHMFMASLDIEE